VYPAGKDKSAPCNEKKETADKIAPKEERNYREHALNDSKRL